MGGPYENSNALNIDQLKPFLSSIVSCETKLTELEADYLSIIGALNNLNSKASKINKKIKLKKLAKLCDVVSDISRNQMYDLSILLGIFAQEEIWITSREISLKGDRHSDSVVKKNLLGQDEKYSYARGSPKIRILCKSKTEKKRKVFRPHTFLADLVSLNYHLRKSLGVITNVLEKIELFKTNLEKMENTAFSMIQNYYQTNVQLRNTKLAKSSEKLYKNISRVSNKVKSRLENGQDLLSKIRMMQEGLNDFLEKIRKTSVSDILLAFKNSITALDLIQTYKDYSYVCILGLKFAKSFIESHAKNHDLSRIRIEVASLLSQGAEISNMLVELNNNYSMKNITKDQYEKRLVHLEKTFEIMIKRMIVNLIAFKIC